MLWGWPRYSGVGGSLRTSLHDMPTCAYGGPVKMSVMNFITVAIPPSVNILEWVSVVHTSLVAAVVQVMRKYCSTFWLKLTTSFPVLL